MNSTQYPAPARYDGPIRYERKDSHGDHWLIGIGIASVVLAIVLGIIGASQENDYYNNSNPEALYAWAGGLIIVGPFLILLGTIVWAGKAAGGRR